MTFPLLEFFSEGESAGDDVIGAAAVCLGDSVALRQRLLRNS